ncbi:hypothetical protein CRM22_004703 [Opisthorchis felineus]|uniref:V-type proton ATPase subunit H n=1 Tax=Opisthorchis felineus TaxID=147828 RepID=A0A4S2LUY7_OPIFE|nr:hypothetical protein CRM22_004703 [Opisthorchis felineus]
MSLEYARVGTIEDITSIGTTTSFLQATAAEIRLTRVNWQSYLQGQIINTEQFNFITRLDNAPTPEARTRVINEDPQLTARVFIFILNRISKEQTLQYILTLLDDILQEDKLRVEIFCSCFHDSREAIWPHFFSFFQRGDPFCMYQASRIVAKFACWSRQLMEEKELMYYLNWLRDQLLIPKNEYDQTVARNLQMMLRIPKYRARYAEVGGIETIVEVLGDKRTGLQLQYQLIFCLWCMSFDEEHVKRMCGSPLFIPTVADIFREAEREKIIRISLALFREKLSASIQDVSSLEEYTTELKSGRLEWSPVHKSEKFWHENAVKFTDNNYEVIKMLVRLVELSVDSQTLSVAVHDIGEFVRHYPRGKQVIENLGGKQLVMGLLQHEDPNVRYNALLSLQKIMVHNWEYLEKQLDSAQSQEPRTGDIRSK